MVDFTGGISRVFNIVGNSSDELFAKMLPFYKRNKTEVTSVELVVFKREKSFDILT